MARTADGQTNGQLAPRDTMSLKEHGHVIAEMILK